MHLTFQSLKKISQKLSILYVEDDIILQKSTTKLFQNLFKQVDVAQDGIEGLKKYLHHYDTTKKYYDIVISDIQMPNLNGIGLAKKIFNINKKQKIIIISAHDDKEYLVDLINIGVEAFIEKPIEPTNMLHILFEVCDSLINEDFVVLKDDYTYQSSTSTLFLNNTKIELSENETKLLSLFIKNNNQIFNCIDISNHLYFDDPQKEFSQDSIKSLIKRLRKKVPDNFIGNIPELGYSINLNS